MKTITYRITDPNGMHATPAAKLVNLANTFQSSVIGNKNGRTADLKKIVTLMHLAIKYGDELTISIEGIDEEEAARKMEVFFKENL